MNKGIMFALAGLSAVYMAGCTQESQENYKEAGSTAAQATEKLGSGLQKDAAVAGTEIKKGAEQVGATTEDLAATAKVKSALMGAKGVNTENLNVDTSNKIITLRGSVPSEDQKVLAEKIAQEQAMPGYTVNDQLSVGVAPTQLDNKKTGP